MVRAIIVRATAWLLVLTAMVSLSPVSTVQAAPSCNVRPNGAKYNTIQAAVYAGCRSIDVDKGIYLESVYIYDSVTISGAGSEDTVVDASGQGSVFTISGGTVTLKKLTIRNGASFDGGGINNGFRATLTVSDSTLTNNQAVEGGAIFNVGGVVSVLNSTISGNRAQTGGGILSGGGTLVVSGSTISNNSTFGAAFAGGGGIYNVGGRLTVSGSRLSGNTVDAPSGGGGGIYNCCGTVVSVSDSTISGNTVSANYGGGGILNLGGSFTFTNTTVVDNIPDNCSPSTLCP
jgi:hypothetical protein